jgi:hypothetical protein
LAFLSFKPLDLTLDVPYRFLEISDGVVRLKTASPQVLDPITDIEVKVLRDLDTFHAARVLRVMPWMVYNAVIHVL